MMRKVISTPGRSGFGDGRLPSSSPRAPALIVPASYRVGNVQVGTWTLGMWHVPLVPQRLTIYSPNVAPCVAAIYRTRWDNNVSVSELIQRMTTEKTVLGEKLSYVDVLRSRGQVGI